MGLVEDLEVLGFIPSHSHLDSVGQVTALSQWPTGPTGVAGFLVAQVMKQAGQGGGRPTPKLVKCDANAGAGGGA
jgi:hypothetical protein